MAWTVLTYRTTGGAEPASDYLVSLEGTAKTRAVALVQLLRERGNQLREPRSKALGDGLFELRDVETGVRIFYAFLPGRRVVLLDGMTKKRDVIPADVLARIRAMQRAAIAEHHKGQ